MNKSVFAVAALVAGMLPTAAKAQSFQFRYEFTYPGTNCTVFGNPSGVNANSAAELGNWGSSVATVQCPFVRDAAAGVAWWDIHVDVRGNVTCWASEMEPNGTGWGWNPSTLSYMSGYNELYFGAQSAGSVLLATALQCSMPGGGSIINQYRVSELLYSR